MLFSTGNSQRSSVAAEAPSRRRAFAEMRSQKRIDPFLAFHNEARPSFWTLRGRVLQATFSCTISIAVEIIRKPQIQLCNRVSKDTFAEA
jgi:hypothetical protein